MITEDPTLTRTFIIRNKKGLHARPSARIGETIGAMDAEVTLTRDGESVSATSIMGILMLGAVQGAALEVTASGPDAEKALETLEDMIVSRFGEDE